MSEAQVIRNSFHGGEVSKKMEGRTDLDSVLAAGRQYKNFLVTDSGGLIKRTGTEHLGAAWDNDSASVFCPFVPNRNSSYLIELGAYKMRFWKSGELLTYDALTVQPADVFFPASSNVFHVKEHGLYHGQEVEFSATTDTLPAGAAISTKYYVVLDRPLLVSGTGAGVTFTTNPNHEVDVHCGPYRHYADSYTSGAIRDNSDTEMFINTTPSASTLTLSNSRDLTAGAIVGGNPGGWIQLVPTRKCLRDTFRLATDPLDLYGSMLAITDGGLGHHTLTPTLKTVELYTPWSIAEAKDLHLSSSVDLMQFWHRDHRPMELRRGENAAFTLDTFEIEDGPYGDVKPEGDSHVVNWPSSASADGPDSNVGDDTVLATMTIPYFKGTDVGKPFRKGYGDDKFSAQWLVGHIERINNTGGQNTVYLGALNSHLWHVTVANSFAISTHGLQNDDPVFFKKGSAALPTGLSERVRYFAKRTDANNFTVSLTAGGADVAITAEVGVIRGHRITSAFIPTWDSLAASVAHGFTAGDAQFGLSGHGRPPLGLEYGREYRVRAAASGSEVYLEEMDGSVAVVMDEGEGAVMLSGGEGVFTEARVRLDVTPKIDAVGSSAVNGYDEATSRWRIGSWGAAEGWPKSAAFVEQRLVIANHYDAPHRFWVTEVGAFRNLSPDSKTTLGVIGSTRYSDEYWARATLDDSGFTYEIGGAGDRVREVLWVNSSTTAFFGTTGGIMELIASSQLDPLTPNSSKAHPLDRRNLADVIPTWSNDALVVVNGAQTHIIAITNDRSRGITFTNLSLYAEHVLSDINTVRRIVYQESPYGVLWVLKTNGDLWSCTLDLDNGIIAWARHSLGGTDVSIDDIMVIPDSNVDKSFDQLYCCVSRTVDGGTVRFIERLERPMFEAETATDGRFMDSFAVYDGAPATVITGLAHLEGETVEVLADGMHLAPHTVASGQITIAAAASVVVVGLKFTSQYDSLPLEVIFEKGTTLQGLPKKLMEVELRLANSFGGSFGSLNGPQSKIQYLTEYSDLDTQLPLHSGLKAIEYDPEYEKEAAFTIIHDEPFPFFLNAILGRLDWAERGSVK